jgi:hypothetical protein
MAASASPPRQAQFIRSFRLRVLPADGGEIVAETSTSAESVRCSFEVFRSYDPVNATPNTAIITLYNLAIDTRRRLEGVKGIQAPVPMTWSKAQLLASDADRNYNGPDAISADPEPLPGVELPPSPLQAAHKYGYAYAYLSAGYGGKIGQIFEGCMVIPRSKKIDPVTWATQLVIGDGTLGANKAIANTSFSAGTEMLTVIRHLLRLLGVGTGNLNESNWKRILAAGQQRAGKPFSTSSTLGWPYAPSGSSAWRDLSLLLELSNVKWMIDGGEFHLLEADGYLRGEAVDLGRPVGAIENPGDGEFRGVFLLNQNARPAAKVTVESPDFPGEFVATAVTFRGDTHEGAFQTVVDFAVIDPLGTGL